MLPQHHLAEIADYIQQRTGKQQVTLGETPAATTGVPIVSYQYLPAPSYKSFELPDKTATATLEKMKTKLQSFCKLSNEQLAQVGSLMDTLAAGSRYHSSKIQDTELAVVAEMLENFPVEETFPALDLARLTVLHPDAACQNRLAYWIRIIKQTLQLASQENVTGLEGPAAAAIPMLSLRLFANALKGGPGAREAVANNLEGILACVGRFVKSTSKNIRLSIATVLYNVCFYLVSQEGTLRNFAPKIPPIVNDILSSKTYESEALFRTLVGLGTLVMSSKDARDAANGLYLASKVEPAASPHGEQAKGVAKEVYNVLQ
jgi:phospholipase A-2-activating protein